MLDLDSKTMKIFKQEIKVKAIFGWIIVLNIIPVILGIISHSSGQSFWIGFGLVWGCFGILALIIGLFKFLAWCFDWDMDDWI